MYKISIKFESFALEHPELYQQAYYVKNGVKIPTLFLIGA